MGGLCGKGPRPAAEKPAIVGLNNDVISSEIKTMPRLVQDDLVKSELFVKTPTILKGCCMLQYNTEKIEAYHLRKFLTTGKWKRSNPRRDYEIDPFTHKVWYWQEQRIVREYDDGFGHQEYEVFVIVYIYDQPYVVRKADLEGTQVKHGDLIQPKNIVSAIQAGDLLIKDAMVQFKKDPQLKTKVERYYNHRDATWFIMDAESPPVGNGNFYKKTDISWIYRRWTRGAKGLTARNYGEDSSRIIPAGFNKEAELEKVQKEFAFYITNYVKMGQNMRFNGEVEDLSLDQIREIEYFQRRGDKMKASIYGINGGNVIVKLHMRQDDDSFKYEYRYYSHGNFLRTFKSQKLEVGQKYMQEWDDIEKKDVYRVTITRLTKTHVYFAVTHLVEKLLEKGTYHEKIHRILTEHPRKYFKKRFMQLDERNQVIPGASPAGEESSSDKLLERLSGSSNGSSSDSATAASETGATEI